MDKFFIIIFYATEQGVFSQSSCKSARKIKKRRSSLKCSDLRFSLSFIG